MSMVIRERGKNKKPLIFLKVASSMVKERGFPPGGNLIYIKVILRYIKSILRVY